MLNAVKHPVSKAVNLNFLNKVAMMAGSFAYAQDDRMYGWRDPSHSLRMTEWLVAAMTGSFVCAQDD